MTSHCDHVPHVEPFSAQATSVLALPKAHTVSRGFSAPCAEAGEHRGVPSVRCSLRCCTNPGFCTAFLTQAPWRSFSVCPSSPSREVSALWRPDCQGHWSVRLVSGTFPGQDSSLLGRTAWTWYSVPHSSQPPRLTRVLAPPGVAAQGAHCV